MITNWKARFYLEIQFREVEIVYSQMDDSKVVATRARHAQWIIEDFWPSCAYRRSDPFKMGIWKWYLSVERGGCVSFRLFPESSAVTVELPPFARFTLSVTVPSQKICTVHEGLLRTCDDFSFRGDFSSHIDFVVDVKFCDLKISPSDGGEKISIWPIDDKMMRLASQSTLKCFSRMLSESLFTDITINTSDGKLRAHKAVLSASSPVFHSMFVHDLKEKQSSTIDIEDMTSETCTALLGYIYGNIKQEDFRDQRLALLAAANKYSLPDLKDACEESLVDDINSDNVLERLQEAWLYRLDKLKKGCIAYLLEFEEICDLGEGMNDFFKRADKELVVEILQEVLGAWKAA